MFIYASRTTGSGLFCLITQWHQCIAERVVVLQTQCSSTHTVLSAEDMQCSVHTTLPQCVSNLDSRCTAQLQLLQLLLSGNVAH
jgi:hypothetical protein